LPIQPGLPHSTALPMRLMARSPATARMPECGDKIWQVLRVPCKCQKAALDVGSGDRFDVVENRAIGRAYLSLLYRRYGNWSDAITAYNWGMGNLDSWIRSGRRSEKLLPAVAMYLRRVLNDSGICQSSQKPVRDCIEPFYRDDLRARRYPDRILPGLEESGRPLPILLASGRPISGMAQSGRLLAGLRQSGRLLPHIGAKSR
jgi:hypothetical protein